MPRKKTEKWPKAIKDAICEQIRDGKDLIQICRQPDYPAYKTVIGWRDIDPEFKKKYYDARVCQIHWYQDRLMQISEEAKNMNPTQMAAKLGYDTVEQQLKNATMIKLALNNYVQALRLEADSLKFTIAKLAVRLYPETFSDVAKVEHSGDVNSSINIVNYANLPDMSVAVVNDTDISTGVKEESKH